MASQIALILIHPALQVRRWHFVFGFELMRGRLGRGYGGGGRRRLSTYRYTVTTRMNPASRWAATTWEPFCNVSLIVRRKVKTVHKLQPFSFEEKGEPKPESNRRGTVSSNALSLGQTGSVSTNHNLFVSEGQSHKTVSTNPQPFLNRKAEPKRNRTAEVLSAPYR